MGPSASQGGALIITRNNDLFYFTGLIDSAQCDVYLVKPIH
jgi:hypothetical protein